MEFEADKNSPSLGDSEPPQHQQQQTAGTTTRRPRGKKQMRSTSQTPPTKRTKTSRRDHQDNHDDNDEDRDSDGSGKHPTGCFGMLKKFSITLQCGGTSCSLKDTVHSDVSSSSSPAVSPTASTLSPPLTPPVETGARQRKRKSPPAKREATTYGRTAKRAAGRPRPPKVQETDVEASADVAPAVQQPQQQPMLQD